MKERPMLFSGPMVRAILDGRKTQTRRVIQAQPIALPPLGPVDVMDIMWSKHGGNPRVNLMIPEIRDAVCPYGKSGDRLWVRETWRLDNDQDKYIYRANVVSYGYKWRPSIFMRRSVSRITLEITDVRVERVQDISEEDAKAEGIAPAKSCPVGDRRPWSGDLGRTWWSDPRIAFLTLWDSINAKRGFGWDVNPFVWVIAFKRIEEAS